MTRPIAKAMFVAMAFSCPSQVLAGLEVCNDTEELQAVAIGYLRDGVKISEGWWPLQPGDCRLPIVRDLDDAPIYLLSKTAAMSSSKVGASFCTSKSAFTILKSKDCAAQGYQNALFRKLVAEEGTSDLKIDLSTLKEQQVYAGAEFVSDDAVFQTCLNPQDDSGLRCTFHADGVRYETGVGTPADLLDFLSGLAPATPISVNGEITELSGATGGAVLSMAETRPATSADKLLADMQGGWISASDPDEHLTILGAERVVIYDGLAIGTDDLSIEDTCGEEIGDGPFLRATERRGGDVYCYAIEAVSEAGLSLIHLPRGNLLEYQRAD